MNKIRLTEADLSRMVHGAVSKLLGIMNEERWYPYPKSENFYNPWHRDYSNKKPKWYDKSLEEPFYDEEGAKAGMEEDAAEAYKAMQSVLFRKAVAIDKWGKKKDVQPKYVDKAFRKAQFQTWNGDLTLAWKYLEARAKETGEAMYQIAIEDMNSPEEEVMDNIRTYLFPELEKMYHEKFDMYQGDYDREMKFRGDIEASVARLAEKYEDADPQTMSYVELCKAVSELEQAYDSRPNASWYDTNGRYFGMGSEGFDQYFEGTPILEIYNAIKEEIKERQASVKKYDIGYINQFTEHGLKHGWTTEGKWAEWNELQELMEKYKTVNRHEWSDHRGDNTYWGELVDEDGELVALYRYQVDSSD